ncbi:MAG: ATP phosphoribosyltransferase regulatory subunit [Clostridiales bacterium]|nr:ATP phosphoribosyltransferase regulatory subunit [Clostridiales bacterium]
MIQTIPYLKKDEQAVFALRERYRRYGYLPYKMSRFEEYDLYVRNKDFLVSDQIITFADRNGKLLALKPDVTLSIIKNSPDRPGAVQKLYYNENVYRADSASRDIREIMQAGLECVGDLGDYEIAEVVLLAARSLALLGGEFVLDLSHMGLIAAVLDECGVTERERVLRCLRQKNAHELREACAGLDEAAVEKLLLLVELSGRAEEVLERLKPALNSDAALQALAELESLCVLLAENGFAGTVRVDFSVGNDMKYYSGVVFKGYLAGIPTGILSGGQYDKLMRKMGRASRAIGFALYLDLLERQDGAAENFDVDTVILHDGTADPAQLTAAAEEAAERGTVLVTTSLPQNRSWSRVVEIRGGKRDDGNG